MRKAILQVADSGPLDSLVEMLHSAGYVCYSCGPALRDQLRRFGCDTVLANSDLVRNEGYDPPAFPLHEAGVTEMLDCDLFVDVKAHRNYARIVRAWPSLRGKVLWYRINGGEPEHVVNSRGDMGDEVNPPCPILTPNQWYKYCGRSSPCSTRTWSYCCWPPFVGAEEYDVPRPAPQKSEGRHNYVPQARYTSPICLVHNFVGWGYGPVLEVAREFGVRIHGLRSPDGLLPHREVRVQLSSALAYVHFKSSDAPGYALYEALASGCPVVCTRRLIWKNRMEELLVPGETCLVFDRPTHDGIGPEELAEIRVELGQHLRSLSIYQENFRIGENGKRKLRELMWSKDKPEDVESLRNFLTKNFGEK